MKKQTIFEIIAIILIAIFCISISPKTLQNDTYYTIKIGEHIIENGGIDMMDPFSWHEGLEYTYPHWLYDVMIYLIYSFGGMLGIYISTCVFATILGITIYKINSKLSNNKVLSFVITIGVIYLLKDFIAARAQLVTFILFILQIFFIEKLISTSQKKYGIGLIAISILIANLHVAVWPFMFVLYLPYVAEYLIAIIEEKIAKRFNKEVKQNDKVTITKRSGTKYLIIVMLICVLTGLLTPLGPSTPYTYLYKTMQGNTTQNINEHLPMTLIEKPKILGILIIFLAIFTLTKTKIRLADLLMIGGLTILMLYSKRQQSMFLIIGSIIFNKLLFDWLEHWIKDIDSKLIDVFTTKIGPVLLCASIIALSAYFIDDKKYDKYIDTDTYPVDMCDFIYQYCKENNINLEDMRIYNEYNFGSYLLFREIPVFIDSRCDLYAPEYNGGRDIFMDYIKSSNTSKWFEDIFKKYDITHLLVYDNSKINSIIRNGELDGYKILKYYQNFILYEVNLPEGE